MDLIMVFGANIRKEREHQGLSIIKLSELSGYNRYSLSTLENGEHDILLSTATDLARALNRNFPHMLSRNFEIEAADTFGEDDYLTVFSENVYRLMKERFLEQSYFHSQQGMEAPNVNRILRKKVNPKLGTLSKLGKGFGIEISDLFRRKGGEVK
jgi:transcriptional regulator with XRE-family HTH domain